MTSPAATPRRLPRPARSCSSRRSAVMSQPHFGISVRMKLTPQKWEVGVFQDS